MKNSKTYLKKPNIFIEETKELAAEATFSESKGGPGDPAT